MNIFDKILELGLKKDGYVVVAGNVLVTLGIVEWNGDIDITVSPDIFGRYENAGWRKENTGRVGPS